VPEFSCSSDQFIVLAVKKTAPLAIVKKMSSTNTG